MAHRNKWVNNSASAHYKGFALPLAMGLGLVMIALATTATIVAQSDRNSSQARVARGANLITTEAGVARILTQLSKPENSPLLTQNYDPVDPATGKTFLGQDGIVNSGDETTVATNEWASSTTSSSCGGTTTSSTAPSISYSGTVSSDATYTLQSYRYDPVKKQGHLLVVGKQGTEKSALKLTLSIEAKSTTVVPGLWIQDNGKSKISGGQLQTNILDSTCSDKYSSKNVADLKTAQVPIPPGSTPVTYIEQAGKPFPDLPIAGSVAPTAGTGTYSLSQITNSTGSLPRSGDTPHNGVLTYHVGNKDSIKLSGGGDLTVGTGNETIVLYLDGGMDFSGGSSIQLTPGTKLIIYARGDLTLSGGSNNGSSADLQIYNYTNGKITLSGGSTMKVFLFAPTSVVTLSSTSRVEGTIWSEAWVGTGSPVMQEKGLDLSQTKVTGMSGGQQIKGITEWRKVQL
jgi:hypothetical protein